MLQHLATVIGPVFACALIGFLFARLRLPFDRKVVGTLVKNVGYPSLILTSLAGRTLAFAEFTRMMGAALVVALALAVASAVLLRLLGLPIRSLLSPMMLNNVGNVGLPVCSFAFGAEGLAYGLAFVMVVLVGTFTVGTWLPKGSIGFWDLVRQPTLIAIVLGLFLLKAKVLLSAPVERTLSLLGGMAIPLMLLTLGHSLAELKVGNLWRGTYLALLRLGFAAGAAALVLPVFGFEGPARGVFLLQTMMPAAVSTYLFVELYRPGDAQDVASLCLVSTLLSVGVLSAVLSYAA